MTTLVTGFAANFLAGYVVRELLDQTTSTVTCLVSDKFRARATAILGDWERDGIKDLERITILEGDTSSMDLGLSGREFIQLAKRVSTIHHCAFIAHTNVERARAHEVNVEGTREVIELAREATALDRLVHWSSALVSGTRRGFVLEEELATAEFTNTAEETRFISERLVRREGDRVPSVILRPGIVVGDSRTGEIDRFEGPYFIALLLLNSPVDLRVPLPSKGAIPWNLVPVDYVAKAGVAISLAKSSTGRTFHIVDPKPSNTRHVFEVIANALGKPVPRHFATTGIAAAIMRAPILDRFAVAPRTLVEQLGTEVVYDARNADEILKPAGIRCPDFDSYGARIAKYVATQQSRRRSDEQGQREPHDALM